LVHLLIIFAEIETNLGPVFYFILNANGNIGTQVDAVEGKKLLSPIFVRLLHKCHLASHALFVLSGEFHFQVNYYWLNIFGLFLVFTNQIWNYSVSLIL